MVQQSHAIPRTRKDPVSPDDEHDLSSFQASEKGSLSYFHHDPSNSRESSSSRSILGAKEMKEVNRMRLLFVLVVLMSIGGAVAVFYFSKHFENESFQQQFYDYGNKVLASIGSSIENSLGGLDSLAGTIVSISRHTQQSFPFVTLLDYGIHASKSMTNTKAIGTSLAPVVTFGNRTAWENYAARYPKNTTNKNTSLLDKYVMETIELQEGWQNYYGPTQDPNNWTSSDVIYSDNGPIPYNKSRPGTPDIYLPEWHKFPLIMKSYAAANWDWLSMVNPTAVTNMISKRKATISQPLMIPDPGNEQAQAEGQTWCKYYQDFIPPDENCMEPLSQWYYPILSYSNIIDVKENHSSKVYPTDYEVQAALIAEFYWRDLMKDILPGKSKGLILVSENTCVPDVPYTYQIDGPNVTWIGVGDHHDMKYDQVTVSSDLLSIITYRQYTGVLFDQEDCLYNFRVYPSDAMKQSYETNQGVIFAAAAAAFIIIPFLCFVLYDMKTSKRQQVILSKANQSDAIVSSLFPKHVRDKLMAMDSNDNVEGNATDAPIAELYPETTVLFADLADFTVWASVRDPFQVFELLETLYGAYDRIAERRKVFKVETVGDCYIAVCGIPKPSRYHAVTMAKFAKEILIETAVTTLKLERRLGPGTSTLRVRVGLNSGPTTAGVLRGAKGRFQLFGDTVNTASRMESNSLPGQILASEKTANCLIAAGKEHWVTRRDDMVQAKGKGSMQCYWINPVSKKEAFNELSETLHVTKDVNADDDENGSSLMVDWIAGLFEEMLQEIVQARATMAVDVSCGTGSSLKFGMPSEEVTECIEIQSNLNTQTIDNKSNSLRTAALSTTVKTQIQEYVGVICSWYAENPFHNFEHACHVILATRKLLARVVKRDEMSISATAYGITSDSLTQFAIVFSALIHDLDHPGVSNAQLVKEQHHIAIVYQGKSVAEQNSITMAWDLLMEARFSDLRDTILTTDSEYRKFRQLLVNAVMATDLFDKDLKVLREERWNKAFLADPASSHSSIQNLLLDSNRRATIVIEHIIQAADVSHTMQHWHVYQKWNKRLLREMYVAYINGRAEKDPTAGWYQGELWFFDNYIIPLAKKLKTCGVFGVSCDELLDYALENRAEWEVKGQGIVAESIVDLKDGCSNNLTHSKPKTNFVKTTLSNVIESFQLNPASGQKSAPASTDSD